MNTNERVTMIAELANRDKNIGKTAMMKFLFLLQTVYSVPLGYDFEIYTYGPYSQSVMSDLEYAEYSGDIKVSPVYYPNGMNGYQINATEEGREIIKDNQDLINTYNTAIENVIHFFAQKTAKELELYSTIVFVASSFTSNGWYESDNDICSTVKQIKPHFSDETISAAFSDLKSNHLIMA